MHHPKSAVERTTLPRQKGGRGLVDIKSMHNGQIRGLRQYFRSKQDQSEMHRAIVSADRGHTPLNMCEEQDSDHDEGAEEQEKLQAWAQKVMHGRHYHELDQAHVDKEASNAWLMHGDLFPETEGFMIAIQDQVVCTRNYRKCILKDSTVQDVCRRCHQTGETIQHVTAGCSAIVQSDYKQRHDQVAKIIHQTLAIKHGLATQSEKYYQYEPRAVMDNAKHKMYWDRTITTDKTVQHNRPDITLIDKAHKTVYLVDIAVPNSNNVQKTCEEKKAKYKDLSDEIKSQWAMNRVIIIPIVISATGIIPHSIHDSTRMLDLNKYIYVELQKAVILSTCHIVRKFLN